MFTPKSDPQGSRLAEAIDALLEEMKSLNSDSPEYAKMVKQLIKLRKLQVETRPPRVSPDVLTTVAANLAGIVIIVGHERAHILTSKALSFLQKLR